MTTRRDFISRAMLSAAALGAPSFMRPRGASASPYPSLIPSNKPPIFELEELTIGDLRLGLTSGRWTSVSIVQQYLARIDGMDHTGPALHAMIEMNPDAERIASALDEERKSGKIRGPLHGIPVVVKDNIGTADRMHTSAGSAALAQSIAPNDAFVIQKLREAGAIILGKSNMSEWSSFRSTHPSSGWSGRGGQARNPYALDRSPAGSSSGSAIAVAASYVPAGIGTETDGSIVGPSSACSVVGLKPTVGLLSRSGLIPISSRQDTPGPMARNVTDVALLLNALVGVDPKDDATNGSKGNVPKDYLSFLQPDGLQGARIGIARPTFHGYSAEGDAQRAIEALEQAGATVEITDIPHVDDYADSENIALQYEFKNSINAYLASLGPNVPVKTLKELIEWNTMHADIEMRFFAQELFEMAETKGGLDEKEYRNAVEKNNRLSRVEGLDVVFEKYNLDAIVSPTMPPAWMIDLVNGDPVIGTSSAPAAVSGYPSISLPIGYQRGLPVGLSFIGRAWSEPTLLKFAYALEQIMNVDRPPTYLTTAQLNG